jgi:predicted  nucleic acid-binding Zn-ribbon protein
MDMNNRPPLLTALLHPLNLAMLALTIAAGLCSAWWLAPIGFVFWLVMVIVIARDPGIQITFTRQSRQPLAQRYQTRFDKLDRARISIFNSLQGSSPSFRRAVEPVQSALDDLVEHAYQLSLHMTALDNNFAVQQISSNFDDDIAKMEKNIQNTDNPVDRREFEQTLESLKTRKTQLKSVNTLLSRFEAQMTGTNNAIDSVVTGVVSLQGRSAKGVEEKIPSLVKIIEAEQEELKQFDTELEKTSLI